MKEPEQYFDLLIVEATEPFGSDGSGDPVKQWMCGGCGGLQFEVGCGSYYTAIRCTNCGIEQCVHDG